MLLEANVAERNTGSLIGKDDVDIEIINTNEYERFTPMDKFKQLKQFLKWMLKKVTNFEAITKQQVDLGDK